MDRCCRLQPCSGGVQILAENSRSFPLRNPDATRSKSGRKCANGWVRGGMGGHGSGKKQCERFVKGCNWLQKQVCVASMVMLNSLKLCWDSRAFISRQRRDVSAILFVTCSQRERERERGRERGRHLSESVLFKLQPVFAVCMHWSVGYNLCKDVLLGKKGTADRHHLTPLN